MAPEALPSAPSVEALLAHRDWVRALARRLLGQDADVDDVEQLTWIAAMRQPRLAAGTLRAFLARIVRNLALDRVRERARRARHERHAARAEATRSVADTVARAEAHRRVVEAVLALEEPYRTTMLLRFFDDLPPRDIARRLGCDVEAVRTRIRRGLGRMREGLGPRMDLALAPLLFLPGILRRTGVLAMSTKKTIAAAALVAGIVGAGFAVTAARERAEPPPRAPRSEASRVPAPAAADTLSAAGARPDAANAAQLVVSVRVPDGRGLRGARLFRVDASGNVLAETAPDADGAARFDRYDGDTHVLARVPGAPLAWVAVPRGALRAEIVVMPGAALEGGLLVDGVPPAQPIALSLLWQGGMTMPKVVRSAANALDLDPDGAACETERDGGFRFDGIPATENAWIAVPPDFVLASGGRSLRVSVPGPFVRLEALALPRLRGRIVFEGGGAGVPRALLHVAWTTGDCSGHMAVDAAPDGRFDFALPMLALEDVSLSYADAAAVTFGGRSLGAVGRGVHDLGDLVVPALLEGFATLRVVDADGRPVEGAVARSEGASTSVLYEGDEPRGAVAQGFSRDSEPSGADGVLRLPVCAEPYFARIHARGFEPAGRPIEAAREETVTLTRTTALSVRVEAAGGPSGLVLLLSAKEPLFALEAEAFQDVGFSESSSSEEGGWYAWILDERGEVRIHGVAADVPFTVSLVDAFGAAHAAQQVVLGKGEARSLAVRLDAPARKVTVAVRDASGSPVEGAEVVGWVGERWMRVAWATTAADGSFVLDGARTREVRILVLAKGFVPRAIAAATDRNHEIRLERGRRVRFRVTDAAGAPVGDAEVRVVCDGFLPEDFPCDPWVAAEVEQGLYEIDGLPGGEVTVSVRTREHAERFRHDTRKPEGELVLGSD